MCKTLIDKALHILVRNMQNNYCKTHHFTTYCPQLCKRSIQRKRSSRAGSAWNWTANGWRVTLDFSLTGGTERVPSRVRKLLRQVLRRQVAALCSGSGVTATVAWDEDSGIESKTEAL